MDSRLRALVFGINSQSFNVTPHSDAGSIYDSAPMPKIHCNIRLFLKTKAQTIRSLDPRSESGMTSISDSFQDADFESISSLVCYTFYPISLPVIQAHLFQTPVRLRGNDGVFFLSVSVVFALSEKT